MMMTSHMHPDMFRRLPAVKQQGGTSKGMYDCVCIWKDGETVHGTYAGPCKEL